MIILFVHDEAGDKGDIVKRVAKFRFSRGVSRNFPGRPDERPRFIR